MSTKRVHIIAIGGAAMHNIALDLQVQGYHVSGSDDEIYNPSLGRLQNAALAPEKFGWFPDKITKDLDFIILGMHAKSDNPELLRAQSLDIPVYSYPEFIFKHSVDKKRVVIAGSHGKTTTTAMVMHVLKKNNIDFDYLIGASISGFERMVKLTDAPMIIIEGDEYLSSPIDRVPKIHHYHPHIAVITGIAWDHINVFPTFEEYIHQFSIFRDMIEPNGTLIYYTKDNRLKAIAEDSTALDIIGYEGLTYSEGHGVMFENTVYPISVIGEHNLQNMNAARLVCQDLGINYDNFFKSISDFSGANKRLQKLSEKDGRYVYLDFAHAPSKVKATTDAFKKWYSRRPLVAVLELHTFSSLNKDFIGQYKGSLDAADYAVVFYNSHTIKMKNMPELDPVFVKESFSHPHLDVFTDKDKMYTFLSQQKDSNILLMTSGNFNKMNMDF